MAARRRARALVTISVLTAAMLGVPAIAPVPAGAVTCPANRPGGPAADSYYPLTRLGFEAIWPLTEGKSVRTGDPVTVAVIDSGLNLAQPQLHHVDRAPFIDAIKRRKDVAAIPDCVGHGTAVTGIIAAQPRGGSPLVGVAPQARILAIKQTGDDGTGSDAGLAYAIGAAADAGAEVINISGGTYDKNNAAVLAAVRSAAAADAVVVAAAGNDQATTNAPLYPAAYSGDFDNILAVSAVDTKDAPGNFSTSGHYVDIAAPGQGYQGLSGPSGFTKVTGTSFATPLVSGAAALVRAAHPDMTAAQVVRRLEATADPPPGAVPDQAVGYGVVNPYLAVTSVTDDGVRPSSTPSASALPARAAAKPEDRTLQHVAVGVSLVLFGLAVVAGLAALVLRGGRRRNRHSGRQGEGTGRRAARHERRPSDSDSRTPSPL
jgi:type VII secretion-associated serine protease mycosin